MCEAWDSSLISLQHLGGWLPNEFIVLCVSVARLCSTETFGAADIYFVCQLIHL